MKKRVYRAFVASVTASLLASLSLWMSGCGGGAGGTSVPPLPPGSSAGTIAAAYKALLPAAQQNATTVGTDTCLTVGCHDTVRSAKARAHVRGFADTKHFQNGVGCENCHGPGSAHAAAARSNPSDVATLRSTLLFFPNTGADGKANAGIEDPIVCAQCHTQPNLNQYNEWINSMHAVLPAAENPNAANFFNYGCPKCHSSLVRVWNFEQGVTGVPDAATTAALTTHTATCTVCHDPMDTGEAQSPALGGKPIHSVRHQLFNLPTDYNSQLGPGSAATQAYTTFDHVCAECHNARGTDPSDTALQSKTSRPSLHEGPQYNMLIGYGGWEDASGPARRFATHRDLPDQCVHCHMAGGHGMVVAGNESKACSSCHGSDAATLRGANGRFTVQNDIQGSLDALKKRLDSWGNWEYSAQGGPADQTTIPLAVKRARYNYYFVARDRSLGVHNIFYTRYLLKVANDQLTSIGVKSVTERPSAKITSRPVRNSQPVVRPMTLRQAIWHRLRGR